MNYEEATQELEDATIALSQAMINKVSSRELGVAQAKFNKAKKKKHMAHMNNLSKLARIVNKGNSYASNHVVTEEHKAKVREANSHPQTEEHKEKRRLAMIGKNIASKPIVSCPHCDKEGGVNMMKRWHFDNCRLSPNFDPRTRGE